MPKDRGVFISLEGGEGAGKGTQLRLLRSALTERGIEFIGVREPGGTEIGEAIRQILLHLITENMMFSDRAELLLYGAARAQLVDEVIEPALASGVSVLADRFFDSTTAYQVFGRGLDHGFTSAMRRFATMQLSPVKTIYLDIDPRVGLDRATTGGADRLESEEFEFHQKVREGYRWIAQNEPERFVMIDADGTPDEVFARVIAIVSPLFDEWEKGGGR